jgi:hypothetical protein
MQMPPHTPFAQMLLQGTALPHCPFDAQVCTALPEHWVALGEHTPVHAPLTHAWFVQGEAPPN